MWKAKCCNKSSSDPQFLMRHNIELVLQELQTATIGGVQKNTYVPSPIRKKLSYIKDRSLTAQDTAITNGIKDTSLVKEFILKYFDTTGLQFNEIIWSNTRFKVLTPPTKQSTVRMDGKLYIGTDAKPFISILAGIIK